MTTISTMRMTIFSTGTSLVTSIIIGVGGNGVGTGVYVGNGMLGVKEVLANSNLATTVPSISIFGALLSMHADVISVFMTRRNRINFF